MFDLMEVAFSLGAAACTLTYITSKVLNHRGKGLEADRLRGVVDEAHHNVRELQDRAGDHVEWENKQLQGWLQVHQLAVKALKDYGPEDAYRGSGAPGREQLLRIRAIASVAFAKVGPATEDKLERDLQYFIEGKVE